MGRNKLLVLFLLLSFHAAGQKKIPVSDGLHRVVLKNIDTTYEFFCERLPQQQKFLSDRMYYWYRPDTIMVTQGRFFERVLNGSFKAYFPGKSIYVSGKYFKGLKEGEWTTWYPTGGKKHVENWKAGMREGANLSYSSDGSIVMQGRYKNGNLDGTVIQYSELKKGMDTVEYIMGKPVLKKGSK